MTNTKTRFSTRRRIAGLYEIKDRGRVWTVADCGPRSWTVSELVGEGADLVSEYRTTVSTLRDAKRWVSTYGPVA